eukprot:CAMPEP_0168587130 /NCGR_PEP_ID=MMETSP0420-20121227/4700_1 /TAXON_ID=498008 /ORGANISM="Pessonella sp." /LENGTH=253 /DNA_ID=CAMNT_0008622361 /DNA_START=220 /DNA_END=978 /DNA_ORIENTATION=+
MLQHKTQDEFALFIDIPIVDKSSKNSSALPTGVYGLSKSTAVKTEQLKDKYCVKDFRPKLKSGAVLRFARTPKEFNIKIPSEGIEESLKLDVALKTSKVLSALCTHFELPTTNEYVLCSRKEDQYIALDSSLRLLKYLEVETLYIRTEDELGAAGHLDLNIWDEGDGEEFITFEDKDKKKILAATFNKLVVALTSSDEYDRDFLDVFLMTYKAFATADMLLKKLGERWAVPKALDDEATQRVRLRVGVFIQNW